MTENILAFPWLCHDFVVFSMSFPGFPWLFEKSTIFQVFPDRWEPCKSWASSVVVPWISVIDLVNGAQFLNATCVAGAAVTVISPLPKM